MIALPVLIPVNRLERAKGRLAELLTPDERRTLSTITLEAVLHAAGKSAIVLTPDPEVRQRVGKRARLMEEDPKRTGLNEQLEVAVATLVADGTASDGLLILHGDLPLASEEALDVLAEESGQKTAVMVESRDGGTNAMLARPAGAFPLAYGPGSFARHVEAARTAGMTVVANTNRELRLDLDTPDDIRELLRAPRGRQGAAGVFLLSIGIEQRLERLK
ncbi:MAG: 2-phospho-L-lactate guanylyltransferase [Dehalococcoidia bacterium]